MFHVVRTKKETFEFLKELDKFERDSRCKSLLISRSRLVDRVENNESKLKIENK